jgi:hypothetical protein
MKQPLVHQHDKDADLSLYSAPGIFGDWPLVTPQFHFGALQVNIADRESRSDEFDQAQNDALGFFIPGSGAYGGATSVSCAACSLCFRFARR